MDSVRRALVYYLRVYEKIGSRLSSLTTYSNETPSAPLLGKLTLTEFLNLAQSINTIDTLILELGDENTNTQLGYLKKYLGKNDTRTIPKRLTTRLRQEFEELVERWDSFRYWFHRDKQRIPLDELFGQIVKQAQVKFYSHQMAGHLAKKYQGLIRLWKGGTVREKTFEIETRFRQIYPDWSLHEINGLSCWKTAEAAVLLMIREDAYSLSFFPHQYKIATAITRKSSRPQLIPELTSKYAADTHTYPEFDWKCVAIQDDNQITISDKYTKYYLKMVDYLTAVGIGTLGLAIDKILWFPTQAVVGIFLADSEMVLLIGGEPWP